VRKEVQDEFNDELQLKLAKSVWTMGGCASWYLDRRGRNTTLWPDFTWAYKRALRRFDPAAYLLDRKPADTRERVSA
jgi:hypothetical protein